MENIDKKTIPINEESINKIIKTQIEYYLSDNNLESDEYFHNLISSNKEGYIPLDIIMSCNKIKQNNLSKDQIISSLLTSTEIELDEEKTKIRRKNNKILPILNKRKSDYLNKKRTRKPEQQLLQEKINKNKLKDPIILLVKSDKETKEQWSSLERKYKQLNPKLIVIYARFNKNIGHFAVYPTNTNPFYISNELLFIKEFTLNDIKYTVELCKGDDLIKFYKEHSQHLKLCTVTQKEKKLNKKNQTRLNVPITLGNETFKDIGMIKHKVRTLLSNFVEKKPLEENDKKFIVDLLQFHNDKDIILNGLKDIYIAKINPHTYSKAFYAIGDNDKKDEFVVNKCIKNISILDKKNNK